MEDAIQTIAAAIQEHLESHYHIPFAASGYDHDTDLVAAGAVDSFGMIELVGFLEERFQVVLDDDDLTDPDFARVRRMAELVAIKGRG